MVWILPFVLLAQEVLSRQEPVYPQEAVRAGRQGTVVLSYRIGKDGSVEDIETVSGHPSLVIAAGTNLATWRFNPEAGSDAKRRVSFAFEVDLAGESRSEFKAIELVRVIARIPDPVTKAGCPTQVSVSSGALNSSDFVELSRSECYGTCLAYAVRVYGNGKVLWNGVAHVSKRGMASHLVPPQTVRVLIERFRSKDVWSLCDQYATGHVDGPTTTFRVSINDSQKFISDSNSSTPRWFRELRMGIDRVGETHRYRPGAPLEGSIENINSEYLSKPGVTDLMVASNRLQDVKPLIAGADVNAEDASGWTALMYAAAGGSRGAIADLLRAGADPRHVSKRGETVVMVGAVHGFFDPALAKLAGNINEQDQRGMTALMYLVKRASLDNVEAAIRAGADIRIRDKQGRTALHYVNRDLPELRRLLSGK
jgi:TonB family protein